MVWNIIHHPFGAVIGLNIPIEMTRPQCAAKWHAACCDYSSFNTTHAQPQSLTKKVSATGCWLMKGLREADAELEDLLDRDGE